jgi:UDP-N-acetyl-D-mannosaminuronic acid dehydrogenase
LVRWLDQLTLKYALEQANDLVGLVDHKPFKALSNPDINSKVVVDTRGLFNRF